MIDLLSSVFEGFSPNDTALSRTFEGFGVYTPSSSSTMDLDYPLHVIFEQVTYSAEFEQVIYSVELDQ